METGQEFLFGAAWYPEWEPEGAWLEDLERMKDAGLNTVRIAEFSWEHIEPKPGHFNFDLYDRVMHRCAERHPSGTSTPLCHVTGSHPCWPSINSTTSRPTTIGALTETETASTATATTVSVRSVCGLNPDTPMGARRDFLILFLGRR